MDIAYIPFVERFQVFLLEALKYDITEGRPKLAAWIEVCHIFILHSNRIGSSPSIVLMKLYCEDKWFLPYFLVVNSSVTCRIPNLYVAKVPFAQFLVHWFSLLPVRIFISSFSLSFPSFLFSHVVFWSVNGKNMQLLRRFYPCFLCHCSVFSPFFSNFNRVRGKANGTCIYFKN